MIHIRFGVPISYLCCRFCNTPEHDDYEPSGREGESEVWGGGSTTCVGNVVEAGGSGVIEAPHWDDVAQLYRPSLVSDLIVVTR